MNIGLFDMDGSLADYEGKLRKDLLKLLPVEYQEKIKNLHLWDLDDQEPYKSLIRMIKSQVNWWKDLPVLQEGIAVFNLAEKIGFHNQILTKGPKRLPTAWKEKVEWCQAHIGADIDIHITSDKGLVYGKFLYDDYPEYMLRWLARRPRGLGIMPANEFNKFFTHPQVIRYNGTNIEEVRAALEACFNRQVTTSCQKHSLQLP